MIVSPAVAQRPLNGNPKSRRAPLWFRALIGGLAFAALVELGGSAADGPLYPALDLPFALITRLAVAGLWSALFIFLLLDLIRKRAWAFRWAAPLVTAYAAARLLWLAVLARSDYDQGRIGAQLILSLIALGPVWYIALRGGWLRREV